MRPTFLGFQIAGRALAASQANLEVTGNNIANVNTEGYSRQRVDLNSISASGFNQKYSVPGASVGLGVEASGISQIRDPFLDLRYRSENAESGKLDTLLSGLSDLENIFDETENPGLQAELSNFLNQLQELSKSPQSKDLSLIVRTAAQKLTQIINIYSQQTDQVRDQQIYGLKNIVVDNDFNALVKNISSLNQQIREDQTYGDPSNELMDRRNTLVDQLSRIANIKVTMTPEKISENQTIERMSISLYDPSSGTSIGLVNNDLYNTLSVDDSKESLSIQINSSFNPNVPGGTSDITNYFKGGVIKGYLDVINGKGTYSDTSVGENTFRGALHYRGAMNTFAAKIADVFNNINAVADPSAPPDGIIPKPLFEASDGGISITAGNIRISAAWLDDPSYITTTKDGDASSGGSDNILKMIQAMSAKHDFKNNSGSTVFEGTYNQYMSGLIGELALDKNLHENFAGTSGNVLTNLSKARESISGVSMDEEGINLMAFQKSYNAAARFLTVLDEAVDTLINRMGIVGR